ncbi:MAG TPA: hypothetical protein PKA28_10765 [Methylomusa anaerophila]|uniref:Uncharacterized protein n=1 Tax=Methylomusa anaerophila TaxID=1930071 RepID=A0A348AIZ5_9FIRM|nr:hypothetical protein [Methylomusa anaerophila]BBB91043.1 hypothetical protein MAMMFC1_01711 [Methylomusa anaerophila]HML88916.1 hypothetical protein [Methylomusa anaerophila]
MPRGGPGRGQGRKPTGQLPNKSIRMTDEEKADLVEYLELRRKYPDKFQEVKEFIKKLRGDLE